MNTLKPCPFCGNEITVSRALHDSGYCLIMCKPCQLQFGGGYSVALFAAWNKRAADDWIQKAIPYLKSELWRISDCLAMPTESGLGADLDAAMDEELDRKHKELTELLKLVEKESL